MNLSHSIKLVVLIFLLPMSVLAQKVDKALQESNDLVYQGNELVDENFIEAEKEYRKAISKLPTNAVGSYNLGTTLYSSGIYDEAMMKLLEATKNASSKAEKHKAYHNIGNALMQQQLCSEAVEAYKNALRNNPSDDESRYNLALAKDCAKNQGGGEGENEDEQEKEQNQEENENQDDQQDQGENEQDDNQEGNDDQNENEGDDKEDEEGKPNEDKSDKPQDKPSDKQRKPQPGKLSPQQVKNLLEAMNNQEKKVQEKINARKAKGVKVQTEKDW